MSEPTSKAPHGEMNGSPRLGTKTLRKPARAAYRAGKRPSFREAPGAGHGEGVQGLFHRTFPSQSPDGHTAKAETVTFRHPCPNCGALILTSRCSLCGAGA